MHSEKSNKARSYVFQWILFVLCALFVAFLILKSAGASQKPPQSSNPCPDSKPCIQLTQADRKVYLLNDFRFIPGRCLIFISLPDGIHRKTCGNYTLDWIGMSQNIKTGDKPVESGDN